MILKTNGKAHFAIPNSKVRKTVAEQIFRPFSLVCMYSCRNLANYLAPRNKQANLDLSGTNYLNLKEDTIIKFNVRERHQSYSLLNKSTRYVFR